MYSFLFSKENKLTFLDDGIPYQKNIINILKIKKHVE